MAKKLTENRVRLARVPANRRQVFLWDSQVTGFGVRIFPGDNKKTFWFMYRPEGGRRTPSGTVMSRMVRIGTFPTLTVADARKAARKFAGQVARGEDPAARRRAERTRSATTLRALLAADGPTSATSSTAASSTLASRCRACAAGSPG